MSDFKELIEEYLETIESNLNQIGIRNIRIDKFDNECVVLKGSGRRLYPDLRREDIQRQLDLIDPMFICVKADAVDDDETLDRAWITIKRG